MISDFNSGAIRAGQACLELGVCRSRLYELRAQWLRDRSGFMPGMSGGDRSGGWPRDAERVLERLLSVAEGDDGEPFNFALAADCVRMETGWSVDRTTVMRHCMARWPGKFPAARRPRPPRRWAMEEAGALWQIDSTPVSLLGPGGGTQHFIAVLDDATREIVASGLYESDCVESEMDACRAAFERRGIPAAIYTDGFSVFGREGEDISSAYGRMCAALSIRHVVAQSPRAKGKIERTMRTFQHRARAVVLGASGGASSLEEARAIVDRHVADWNATHVNATTGMTPEAAFAACASSGKTRYRPMPPQGLLDLFMARHVRRSVSCGDRVRFGGREFKIARTGKKHVWLVIRPDHLLVVDADPLEHLGSWPVILGKFTFKAC